MFRVGDIVNFLGPHDYKIKRVYTNKSGDHMFDVSFKNKDTEVFTVYTGIFSSSLSQTTLQVMEGICSKQETG